MKREDVNSLGATPGESTNDSRGNLDAPTAILEGLLDYLPSGAVSIGQKKPKGGQAR